MVGVILFAFAFQIYYAEPEGERIVAGLFTPAFQGTESVLLAAGILGATVMPHVIYLHSTLTQRWVVGKTEEEKKIFRFELVDVVLAMSLAGFINASMLLIAAALFNANGLTNITDIDLAFEQLGILVNDNAAILFGLGACSLRASRAPRYVPWPARSSCRAS
ncbi:MAG: Nramp family divalent metal transporter [Rubrobacter sp.]|nr:Nramp family divalent metal transporter [Rubrobacter sp.]